MSTGLLPRRSTSAGAECKSSAPPCTREDAGSGECAPAGRCFVAVALLPPSAPIARIARRPSLRAERLAVGERATLRSRADNLDPRDMMLASRGPCAGQRSEERRVGKEGRGEVGRGHGQQKAKMTYSGVEKT